MEIKKVKINETEYEFVNQWQNSRNGFNHISTLFKNGYELATHKVHYINRTWERYQFQTAMKGAVEDTLDEYYKRCECMYKELNDISRITKAHRDKIDENYNAQPTIQELKKLYENI